MLTNLRSTATMMAATLLTFWSVREVLAAAHFSLDVLVFATALALMLGRTQQRAEPADRLAALVAVPAASAAAAWVGGLLQEHHGYGDAVFVLALTAAVWIRRFGTGFSRAGSAITVPFVATLIQPVPQPTSVSHIAWTALAGLIALAWVDLLWIAATPPASPEHARIVRELRSQATPQPPGRVRASTRMALQLAVALTAGFVIGRQWYPAHYVWPVLTAYIVSSGNRGRADVAYKGVLRVLGALAGTAAATWLFDGVFGPGSHGALTVLFGILALACFLRPWSYAYWAACITAALAFLTGFFGQPSSDLLRTRLAGIVLGGLAAVAAAWVVLPVRTTDVMRRRRADALAALTDLLAEPASRVHLVRFDRALADLTALRPAVHAARILARPVGTGARTADAIDAMRALARAVHTYVRTRTRDPEPADTLRLLREAMAARVTPDLPDRPGAPSDAATALDDALRAVARSYAATLPPVTPASSGPGT
ncbi:FUSC family protein [Actinoplanes sp. RD1]|uniref:FUSC family protein n=1 Tax=Actinoplanes sp. RD1 TaxID=3064538 RepID=UPI0027428E5F|nr:FUSC family protein [Actinoplanes sp. RD1]